MLKIKFLVEVYDYEEKAAEFSHEINLPDLMHIDDMAVVSKLVGASVAQHAVWEYAAYEDEQTENLIDAIAERQEAEAAAESENVPPVD